MRLPWVSREQYEFVRAQLDASVNREASLIEKYHALKSLGANLPDVKPEVVSLPPKKEDEAKTLIHEIAGKNLKQRAMMLKQLKADRAANVPEEKILEAIQQGVTSDGVPA